MVQAITILVRYNDEQGQKEVRYQGFLTSTANAMYVNEYKKLLFARVEPTNDPDVYLEVNCPRELGSISGDAKTTIEALTNKLQTMTAYEFMANVIIHITEQFDFEGLIIPKLIDKNT